MQLKRQLFAVFLLSVLSLALAPKDWLHEVHEHDDTEHIEAPDGTTAFDNHHHHCIIFTTESPVFTSEALPFVTVHQVLDFAHGTYLTCSDNHRHVIPANLRGPPATCIS